MTTSPVVAEQFEEIAQQREADVIGMWIFLATELLLFGGLFLGVLVYRVRATEAFAHAATHLDLLLGTLNTAILLTSGLAMALTERVVSAGQRVRGLLLLAATILLGVIFLGIKLYEWHHEYTKGLVPVLDLPFNYEGPDPQSAQMFFNLYFAMTGLHALHMIVGLGILSVIGVLLWRWRDPAAQARQVQISGMYWAFVDVVWLFVFTVLYLWRA